MEVDTTCSAHSFASKYFLLSLFLVRGWPVSVSHISQLVSLESEQYIPRSPVSVWSYQQLPYTLGRLCPPIVHTCNLCIWQRPTRAG